jgi:hypothetical protein
MLLLLAAEYADFADFADLTLTYIILLKKICVKSAKSAYSAA